jgi:hypothetical protein
MPNWLPDWKASLNEAFQNYVKTPLEQKAHQLQAQLEQKSEDFKKSNNAFQQAIIAILFASFCVGVIAVNWKDD